jgi:hypothetical protein
MARTYKVDSKVYNGFCALKANASPEVVALIFFDGEWDLWALDWYHDHSGTMIPSGTGVNSLKELYRDMHGLENVDVWTYQNNRRW